MTVSAGDFSPAQVQPGQAKERTLEELFTARPFIIVIAAPSGTGKTTIIRRLLSRNLRLRYSISATTRPRRDSEIDGRDYFFLSDSQFSEKIEAGGFAEWARVHGYCYGTLAGQLKDILESGCHVVMDVDVQGAGQLREHYPDGVYIYLLPPSMEELKRRLESRGTENPKSTELRLRASVAEIEALPTFDYLVINDDVEGTCAEIEGIIRAEEIKVKRIPGPDRLISVFLGRHRSKDE